MDFNKLIIEWTNYDTRIKQENLKLKNLREKKSQLSDILVEYIEENKLTDSTFELTQMNTMVVCKNTTMTTPLTYDFLKSCMNEYFQDKTKTDDLLKFIKNKREKTVKKTLSASDL